MSLKLHADVLSQPCRSVLYVLKKLSIEHEYIHVEIPTGTRSEEFKKNVNPKGQVPVLEVGDVKITESGPIIRYLLDTYDKEEVLLPRTDKLARAKVEEVQDVCSTSIRPSFAKAFIAIVMKPKHFGGESPSEEETKELMGEVHGTLKKLDHLLEGKQFFTGENLTI